MRKATLHGNTYLIATAMIGTGILMRWLPLEDALYIVGAGLIALAILAAPTSDTDTD
jgi:hypothetical protein